MTAGRTSPEGVFVVLDLETTGLDPETDRVVELAAVRHCGPVVLDTFEALVNPGVPLPPAVSRLTGLSDADLQGRPDIGRVLPGLLDFLGRDRLAGHNLRFDLAFLQAEAQRSGRSLPDWSREAIDTLTLARTLLPSRSSHSLAALAEELALPVGFGRRHRAAADAGATGQLLMWLRDQALSYPRPVLAAARDWLAPAREQMSGTWAFFEEVLDRSAAPGARPAVAAPPPQQARTQPAVGRGQLAGRLEEVFPAGGLLSGVMTEFEPRPQQAEMARAVAKALRDGGALAVEAGTGIGKTLAYLAAALATAEAESAPEKVVISTKTVTLQDQMVERDLPLLAAALGRPVRHAVLKGRGHYLCLRRWQEELGTSLVADEPMRRFMLRLIFWEARTRTGDSSELNLTREEEGCWPLVASDEGCHGAQCEFGSRCYVTRARARADQADLVIVNHALLCANLGSGGRLLPEHRCLIIDEAHDFESVATDHLGLRCRAGELGALLGWAGGPGLRGPGLPSAPGAGGWPSAAELAELPVLLRRAQAAVRTFEAALGAGVQRLRGPADGDGASLEVAYRARMEGLPPGVYEATMAAAEAMDRLGAALASLAARAPDGDPAGAGWAGWGRSVGLAAAALGSLGRAERADWVYWLESGTGGPALGGAPIEVGPVLKERLWPGLHAMVLVSATLAVMGSFDHALGRLGLSGDDDVQAAPAGLLLASPFDYRRQALLCIPSDLPEPSGGGDGESAYAAATAAYLADLLPAVGGRALVLFTSHRMLRRVHGQVAAELAGRGLRLLAQGIDGGRSRLLRALRAEERVVVFGASTFWEGIDVRGPQLSCLVIARLPFPRPDDPLVAARQARLESQGQSSFAHYSLPQAVLRLKQGFGRLIRSADDHGAVVILDGRLLRRQYGRVFLRSLPPATRYAGASKDTIARVSAWLGGSHGAEPGPGRGGAVRWVDDRKPPEVS